MSTTAFPCQWLGRLALAASLCLAGATLAVAAEGPMDFLLRGQARPAREAGQTGPMAWKVAEYSAVRIVPAEAGAAPNQHPAELAPERLRAQLAAIRIDSQPAEPLFSRDELEDLVPALVTALQTARPEQDVLLFSTSRRSRSFLAAPLSVVARLFIRDDALQVLVQDARLDVVLAYRSTQLMPELRFGSRTAAGTAELSSPALRNQRPDWLILAPLAKAGAEGRAVPAAAAATVDTRESIEQRLRTLKRLHEQSLISDEDYAQKRRELLQEL